MPRNATGRPFGPDNRPKGRPKGSPNKLTKNAREAFQAAFEGIGGATALIAWAQQNPDDFYKLYARLIPVEHVGDGGQGPVQTVVKHIFEGKP